MNQAAKAASDYADEIAEYLRTLPPLKLQSITLTGPIRPYDSRYEVMLPAVRGSSMTPTVALKTLELARKTQLKVARRRGTFGRGELKLV